MPVVERDLLLLARSCHHRLAPPASGAVGQLSAGKGFLFAHIGDTELRGFEDPVRLYEVRWKD
jgi:hypothetical protein